MAVRRLDGTGEVVLPADYVAQHVELAYATTAHRAQGRTVDTAHALVSPTTTREVLYVAATRGREENRLYVDTGLRPRPAHLPRRAWPGPRARGKCWPPCWPGKGPTSRPTRPSARPSRGAGFAVLAAEYLDHRPGGPAPALGRPPRSRAGSARQSWPLRRRARRTGRSWPRSGTPKPGASTSRRHCPSWRPPGHWTAPTTPSPSCTTGSNAGPPQPAANAGPGRPHRRPRPPGARRGRPGPGPRPARTGPGHGAPGPAAGRTGAGRRPSLDQEPRASAKRGGPEGSLATGRVHRGRVPGPLGARRRPAPPRA